MGEVRKRECRYSAAQGRGDMAAVHAKMNETEEELQKGEKRLKSLNSED